MMPLHIPLIPFQIPGPTIDDLPPDPNDDTKYCMYEQFGGWRDWFRPHSDVTTG